MDSYSIENIDNIDYWHELREEQGHD